MPKPASKLNTRNSQGLTPLLEAVQTNNINRVAELLEQKCNPNIQDTESGYTALHKVFQFNQCLLKGNLKMALLILRHGGIDFNIKDNEKMTFLEMLSCTLRLPKIPIKDICKDEDGEPLSIVNIAEMSSSSYSLWTWGSNKNFLLGSTDLDNRTHPENVKLIDNFDPIDYKMLFEKDHDILQIAMSEYHCVILTKFQVFTYGFGIGGRLGHGSEETIFKPQPVGRLRNITFVAVGPDHTLCVDINGKVWTWLKQV